jgi:predicted TIM-barrel fold metal-dependent hydrolase
MRSAARPEPSGTFLSQAMIIDCHCHTGRADLIDQSWTNGAPMLAYLRRARAAGISKTVVFSQLRGDYNAGNEEVARIVARFPERLIGFVFVDARRDAGHIFGMVDRAVRKHAFRGIKVHGIDAMPTREVCEAARAFRLPVVMDIIGRAVVVEKLAPLYPDVNFIIPHLGSFNDDLGVQQRVVDQLARYENVYADTSGVRRFDSIVQAVKRSSARKLLFGSDGPWLHPGVELHKIRALGLPKEKENLILGGNAARMILRAAG